MQIRCIALDLDQTTLNEEGRLAPETQAALEYAISKGIHIVIASGRPLGALPADVLSVPGIEYAITSNGAAVYHIPTGNCLHNYTLTPDSVQQIMRLTAEEPVTYETFISGIAYADADYVRDPAAFGTSEQGISYIQRTRRPEPDIAGFIRQHETELDSIDIIVRDEMTQRRLWDLLERTVPDIYVTSSVWQLIEISHRDAGKHSGLHFLSELLALTPAQIAAFGDGDNDADMLAYAGCGIAMANASPACLAAADHVTLDHRRHGVAHGIYNILHI